MANLLNEKEQLIELEKLFNKEKYTEALELAELLKKEFTSSFQINLLYAKILRTVKKLDKAEPVLTQLLASHPDNLNVLLETAALSVDLNKIEEAREYYDKVLFIDSFNSQAKEALEKLKGGSEEPGLDVKQPELKKEEPDTEKKPWQEDTLPEEALDEIEAPISDSEPEADEVEITEDSIQVGEETLRVPEKPSIPGVDDVYIDSLENKVDEVSTETVEDFFMEVEAQSKSTKVSTEKAPAPSTEEGSSQKVSPAEGEDFITESAAELYFSQGLYEEALYVYEKLYQINKEEKFVDIIEDLKVKCVGQKKIQALMAFLEIIQQRSS